MELKEGMYVRTKKGIGKINEIRDFMGVLEFHLDSNIGKIHNVTDNTYWNNVDDIIGEPSEHLIDLIEVGDYVNGKRVDEIALIEDVWFVKTKVSNIDNYDYLPERLIEDIVTKEQFNSMKYVVERDK